jgi:hypothetical protein
MQPSSPATFFAWLAAIPAIVWSGVFGATIAATISFFGVRASNRASLDRLREQHKQDKIEADAKRAHDAAQKNEDRKAAIRREIYGQAVEEVHGLLAAIGGLAERPVDDSGGDADALQAFLKSNAKVWLVADPRAARLTRELASAMAKLFFSAIVAAAPIRHALDGVRLIDKRIKHGEEDIRAVEVDIRASVPAGDDQRLKALAASREWIFQWVEGLRRERDAAARAALPARLRCFEATFDELSSAQSLLTKLVSALRAELHLDPDEEEFARLLEGMKRQAWDSIHRIYALAAADAPAA